MKAGDLFMVQYCQEHGSFRALPLQTCEEMARVDLERGEMHKWVIIAHAGTEGEAHAKIKTWKEKMKGAEANGDSE